MNKLTLTCIFIISLQLLAAPAFAASTPLAKASIHIQVIDNDSITPIDYLIIHQLKNRLKNTNYKFEWKKYSDDFWYIDNRLEICFLDQFDAPSNSPARGETLLLPAGLPLLGPGEDRTWRL